jgi:hypothetical protein
MCSGEEFAAPIVDARIVAENAQIATDFGFIRTPSFLIKVEQEAGNAG